MSLYNLANGELKKEIDDLRLENKRKIDEIYDLRILKNKQKKEIERLNNIIDEVRKYIDDNTILEEKINMSYLQIINMTENMFLEGLYEILDKLKELKESQ